MKLDIRVFNVDRADDDVLSDYYDLIATSTADWLDEPPPDFDTAIGRLRSPTPGLGGILRWAAYVDGHLRAFATARLPEQENADVALLELTVHPDFRRRGVATGMLRTILPALREQQRSVIEASSVKKGGPGEHWASWLGCRQVDVTVAQRLALDAVDPTLWEVEAPPGYRSVSWISAAPEELVASYARARNAIHDAPQGGARISSPQWTVERVREREAGKKDSGFEQRVVAAVHRASGDVVGFTEVDLYPHRRDKAIQRDTVVSAEHRGRGLGRFVKAEMSKWLRSDQPELRTILTFTAESNKYMIHVNHQVGYTTTRVMLDFNSDIDTLAKRLES